MPDIRRHDAGRSTTRSGVRQAGPLPDLRRYRGWQIQTISSCRCYGCRIRCWRIRWWTPREDQEFGSTRLANAQDEALIGAEAVMRYPVVPNATLDIRVGRARRLGTDRTMPRRCRRRPGCARCDDSGVDIAAPRTALTINVGPCTTSRRRRFRRRRGCSGRREDHRASDGGNRCPGQHVPAARSRKSTTFQAPSTVRTSASMRCWPPAPGRTWPSDARILWVPVSSPQS